MVDFTLSEFDLKVLEENDRMKQVIDEKYTVTMTFMKKKLHRMSFPKPKILIICLACKWKEWAKTAPPNRRLSACVNPLKTAWEPVFWAFAKEPAVLGMRH